jgi:DNA mismatch repair protein MutL
VQTATNQLPWEEPPAFTPISIKPSLNPSTELKTAIQVETAPSTSPKHAKELEIELPLKTAPEQAKYEVLSTLVNYILAKQNDNSFVIIDQRAAHTRITFEALLKLQTKNQESQGLLIPLTVELPPLDVSFLEDNLRSFEKIGITIRRFGKNTFMVDALPKALEKANLQDLIEKILQYLKENEDAPHFEGELLKKLALAASLAAVPKQRKLNSEEASALIDHLMKCDAPFHSPSGKQTIVHLGQEEIASKF